MRTRLVIMAKAPRAGLVKTRLIPALGAQGAADLAWAMLQRTLRTAQASLGQAIHSVKLCASPALSDPAWQGYCTPAGMDWCEQGTGDLGQRMARVVQVGLAAGEAVLLIGTDVPDLTPALLQDAACALQTHDVSLLPTHDGGYALLGLRCFVPAIFVDMPWSTSAVCALTLQRLTSLTVHIGPTLHDVDEAADLAHWPEPLAFTPPLAS